MLSYPTRLIGFVTASFIASMLSIGHRATLAALTSRYVLYQKQTMLSAASLHLLFYAPMLPTCGKTATVSVKSFSVGNSPSLESDWLISPGQGTQVLGCSPGLSCAFADLWRRLFLLETQHNMSFFCFSSPRCTNLHTCRLSLLH